MSADTAAHRRPPVRRRSFAVVALLTLLALALALSACGGSSGSSSGTTTNSASATKAGGAGSSRFAAMRACLQKEGVNLPSPSSKAPRQPGSGGFPRRRGGFKLPEGISRSKFLEAIKKCGGGRFAGRVRPGFNSATAKVALTKYASCMRENGVNLPTPNTSGTGPVFNTGGIDTTSETFKAAQKKCQTDLKGAFGGGRPPAGGPPPAGEGGPHAGGAVPPAGGYGPPPSEAEGG